MVNYVQDGITYKKRNEILTEGQRNLIHALIAKDFEWPVGYEKCYLVQRLKTQQLAFFTKKPRRLSASRGGGDFLEYGQLHIPKTVREKLPVFDEMVKYWHSGRITHEMYYRVKNSIGKDKLPSESTGLKGSEDRKLVYISVKKNAIASPLVVNNPAFFISGNAYMYHGYSINSQGYVHLMLECVSSIDPTALGVMMGLPKDDFEVKEFSLHLWFPSSLAKELSKKIKYIAFEIDPDNNEPYIILSENILEFNPTLDQWSVSGSVETIGRFAFPFFIQRIRLDEFNKTMLSFGNTFVDISSKLPANSLIRLS